MVPPAYGDYQYPPWAISFGWMVAMCSVMPMPLVAIYKILRAKGTLYQRVVSLLKPTELWGPNDGSLRRGDHKQFNGLIETGFQFPWSKKERVPLHSNGCIESPTADNES